MTNQLPTPATIVNAIFSLAALLILIDFALPGKLVSHKIVDIQSAHQQYYNAGGNSHYSYAITTNAHTFPVTEAFAQSVQVNQKIEYSVSSIFKEVNWYKSPSANNRFIYSLRLVSGLVLPLLAIIVFAAAFKYKKKISTLAFVFQVLVIADLIFLLV
ncbi:hypothetical protein [Roseivirga pacifica]